MDKHYAACTGPALRDALHSADRHVLGCICESDLRYDLHHALDFSDSLVRLLSRVDRHRGLNYISIAIGSTIGAQTGGRLMDTVYRRLSKKTADSKGRPEFRVPILFLSSGFLIVGLFIYGWTTHARTRWIGPNVGAAVFSMGTIMTMTEYNRIASMLIQCTRLLRSELLLLLEAQLALAFRSSRLLCSMHLGGVGETASWHSQYLG